AGSPAARLADSEPGAAHALGDGDQPAAGARAADDRAAVGQPPGQLLDLRRQLEDVRRTVPAPLGRLHPRRLDVPVGQETELGHDVLPWRPVVRRLTGGADGLQIVPALLQEVAGTADGEVLTVQFPVGETVDARRRPQLPAGDDLAAGRVLVDRRRQV